MYYTDEENEKLQVELINDSKRLYEKQMSIIDDAKKIGCLCMQDLCRNIKSYITNYDYIGENVSKANEELQIKDKRRKKENLDFINSLLSKDFFDNKAEIKVSKIIFYGGNTSAYEFEFELNGKQYQIVTPIKANLPFSYNEFLYGKFYIAEKSNITTAILCSAYTIKEIREYIISNIIKEDKNND